MALEVVGIAHQPAQGPQLVVEQGGQPAARVPDEGGGVGHYPLGGEVGGDLEAVELHIARGKEVAVGNEDAAAAAGGGDTRPARQGGPAGGQPPDHLVKGPAVGQGAAEGGGGGEQGGQGPHQPLGMAPAGGGHQGKEDIPEDKQGAEAAENALCAVVGLDLTAETLLGAGPLGIGVLVAPPARVKGDPVGGGGGGCGAAGQAQGAAVVVSAVDQKEQSGQTDQGVRQPLGFRRGGQLEAVGQGEDTGQGGHGIHAEF